MQSCGCVSELQPVGIHSVTQYVVEELLVVHWMWVAQVRKQVVLVPWSAKSVNPYLQDACLHCGEIRSKGAQGDLKVLSLPGDILCLVAMLWLSCSHQVP